MYDYNNMNIDYDNIKEYYKYVTDKEQNWTCIGLTPKAGQYEGVVYRYGKVTIPKEEDVLPDGSLPWQFEWEIMDSNGLDRDKFGDEFFQLIGSILQDIILNGDTKNAND